MASFDVDAALRWARFDPARSLRRRAAEELAFLGTEGGRGPALLLDTCVYIHMLGDRAPPSVKGALETRVLHHSTVAIQELMHSVGALDPDHPGTSAAIRSVTAAVKSMNPRRVHGPDPDTAGRAALLSGILCRIQGYARDAKLRSLQDCTLFLQAQKLGFTVLTANVADFDILLQLIPSGRVLFYRTA